MGLETETADRDNDRAAREQERARMVDYGLFDVISLLDAGAGAALTCTQFHD